MARTCGGSTPRRFIFRVACILVAVYLIISFTRSSRNSTGPYDVESVEQALGPTIFVEEVAIPVIIFAFNRADHLRITIDSVIAAAPSLSIHPIFISQDGDDVAVAEVIASYGDLVTHLKYHWPGKPGGRKTRMSYLKIAGHYQFALSEVMDHVDGHERWDRVIMLEDDMLVSPDFFSYFRRMSPLFDTDPTLYCVSAWNDHGQSHFVSSATTLHRTECFPGLGWMWSRALWTEHRDWTSGYWDDWLREPAQRKGRSCIYPEINRVYTFGSDGASHGRFFVQWFMDILLNDVNVDWDTVEVNHLLQYDSWLRSELRRAEPVRDVKTAKSRIDAALLDNAMLDASEMLVQYGNLTNLTAMMEPVGLMADHKAGVPRTSYKGVLQFRYRKVRIWLVPDSFDLA